VLGSVAQVEEHLPSMCEALGPIPNTTKNELFIVTIKEVNVWIIQQGMYKVFLYNKRLLIV
jgi:hypothetical protein